MSDHPHTSIVSSSLWYLELAAFAVVLVLFFQFFLYQVRRHYGLYAVKYDHRPRINLPVKARRPVHIPVPQRPLCCDADCLWLVRLMSSLMAVVGCYYCCYTLLTDANLKFGVFL